MKEYRWHRGFFHEWERRLTREPHLIAVVYRNAHDGKTFVARIERGNAAYVGPHIYEIQFYFKTVGAAKKWADKMTPSVRRKLTEWRKVQIG